MTRPYPPEDPTGPEHDIGLAVSIVALVVLGTALGLALDAWGVL